ncbi:efflux RND transporter periplasmic adaptor subunit [Tepidicaulis sp. LMO-SS28]|uniref:efflux RND transporter periplasmic adaptor subunit n=1 Tax=Tepidicaulis sp. LMO-SS28 TaxID=3447455 RepID=UPI003EE24D0B
MTGPTLDHENAQETQAEHRPGRALLSKRSAYLGAALLAGGLAFAGLRLDFGPSEAIGAEERQIPHVTVAEPLTKRLVEWDEYTGRFRAIENVEVRARVSGYLNEVAFADGDRVEEGDLLFRLDPRPFEAELAAAEADVASRQSSLENARREHRRGQELVKRGAVSKANADDRLTALKEAEAALEAAKARVETARLNLEFSEVRAPVSGRISDNFISRGNLITGGAEGGTLLTSIVSTDPIHFEFTVSEADYLKYVRRDANGRAVWGGEPSRVELKLLDENGFEHEGELTFIDNQIDASTGTLRGRATFANPDGIFAAGMFARLRVPGSSEYEAVLIPDNAVQTDQAAKFVWVVDENDVAQRREVTLGPKVEGKRIVRAGLGKNDRVVVKGTQFVSAQEPVIPQLLKTAQLSEKRLQ